MSSSSDNTEAVLGIVALLTFVFWVGFARGVMDRDLDNWVCYQNKVDYATCEKQFGWWIDAMPPGWKTQEAAYGEIVNGIQYLNMRM